VEGRGGLVAEGAVEGRARLDVGGHHADVVEGEQQGAGHGYVVRPTQKKHGPAGVGAAVRLHAPRRPCPDESPRVVRLSFDQPQVTSRDMVLTL
jgi:hypothetical protein